MWALVTFFVTIHCFGPGQPLGVLPEDTVVLNHETVELQLGRMAGLAPTFRQPFDLILEQAEKVRTAEDLPRTPSRDILATLR